MSCKHPMKLGSRKQPIPTLCCPSLAGLRKSLGKAFMVCPGKTKKLQGSHSAPNPGHRRAVNLTRQPDIPLLSQLPMYSTPLNLALHCPTPSKLLNTSRSHETQAAKLRNHSANFTRHALRARELVQSHLGEIEHVTCPWAA